MTISLSPGTKYTFGAPVSADGGPRIAVTSCAVFPSFTEAATNRVQTIRVEQTPVPLRTDFAGSVQSSAARLHSG